MKDKKIFVTQPPLPPLSEYLPFLQKIWDTKILSNNGPYHDELERELANYLGVEYLSLFSNATIALITGLQALRISGEVITSPFSFVATTHSLWWNKIKPVFVDIENQFFNLNPQKIEAAITPQTTAIMPVHVYGNPCLVEEIKEIADSHGLRIIYDAAHAFGVKKDGQSILNWGDMSVISFHATKAFSTIEGGAIVCCDGNMKKRIDLLKNFGFKDETTIIEPGINGKMNEIQSAYGLLQLKYIDKFIEKRKKITELYRNLLLDIKGIRFLPEVDGIEYSYTYFPICVNPLEYGISRDELYFGLQRHNILGRRYFYPLISEFPPYRNLPSSSVNNIPIALRISNEIICLPIYPDLELEDVKKICLIIKQKP